MLAFSLILKFYLNLGCKHKMKTTTPKVPPHNDNTGLGSLKISHMDFHALFICEGECFIFLKHL